MGGVLAEQDEPARFTRVLDVGCGTGGWLIELAQAYPTITRLVGIDISGTMLDYARSQADAAGVSERVEFQVMSALQGLEFPDHSFDLVNQRLATSWLGTEAWPQVLQEYQRARRRRATPD